MERGEARDHRGEPSLAKRHRRNDAQFAASAVAYGATSVLHVVKFRSRHLDQMVQAVNDTGFGLTMGIHSRIDQNINYIARNANIGNIYINRNMIGAVVGVQPFGGEGLSGTGPKAGGPHYLQRFCTEKTISINTSAIGGNAELLNLDEN